MQGARRQNVNGHVSLCIATTNRLKRRASLKRERKCTMRTVLLAAIVAGAGLVALAHVAAPADAQVKAKTGAPAQVKTGCSNVIAPRCPKNFHRECSQTSSNGCCKKMACVQN
jgi:hypothetical protein